MQINPKTSLPSILEKISVAVIGLDPDFNIQFANPAAEILFKYKTQEILKKKLNELLENYVFPQINQLETNITEINCIDANNNKIPVQISLKKICDKSKRTIGYIYILKDLSEIKSFIKTLEEKTQEKEQKNNNLSQLQQKLEKEKQSSGDLVNQQIHEFKEEYTKLLASINNLSLGFIMTDIHNNILLNNLAANNILPSLATISKSIKQLQESEQIGRNLQSVLEKSQLEKKHITLSDISANSKYVNIFISPIISEQTGLPAGVAGSDCLGSVIIIEDKSKRHNLEESKENIFSIASHELRTPLTAIYGYASLIKQIYFNDLQNDELKNIINNIGILSRKLSLSVNNFLDSSRLEQDKIELKKDDCSLYTIIHEAINETEKLALEKNLYIKFESPPAPITVVGDQTRLIQVLTILIANAVKFTQIGGIYISIQNQLNFAKIIVQDTGIGIPELNRTLLFTKFQQAEESLLTRQEGAGLGLYIAKLLVEKMGGTIQLEKTAINKGSTFSFTVPIKTQ